VEDFMLERRPPPTPPTLIREADKVRTYDSAMIFKGVSDHRPYPEHGLRGRDWAQLPPQQIRLDRLITTKGTLDLATLLDEDSTFFGDLFAHVVEWRGELYLEDGLHRALRAALQQRHLVHGRIHVIEQQPTPVHERDEAGPSAH
jgi:Arc/MetJ family transcription regulator